MTFGAVQAEESRRFGYPAAHRLVVDAYMAQHPGDGSDRRDRQSVFMHLVGLCAVLERGARTDYATRLLGAVVARQDDFPLLRRSGGPGEITVLHMQGAHDLADYERRAHAWADAVWRSWADQHHLIRTELAAATS
jgi:hypothetical protein